MAYMAVPIEFIQNSLKHIKSLVHNPAPNFEYSASKTTTPSFWPIIQDPFDIFCLFLLLNHSLLLWTVVCFDYFLFYCFIGFICFYFVFPLAVRPTTARAQPSFYRIFVSLSYLKHTQSIPRSSFRKCSPYVKLFGV